MADRNHPLIVYYLIGTLDGAAMIDYKQVVDDATELPPPFAMELDAIGSAHPDDHMGMPENMDGLCQWVGVMRYSSVVYPEALHSETELDYIGRWRCVVPLFQLTPCIWLLDRDGPQMPATSSPSSSSC